MGGCGGLLAQFPFLRKKRPESPPALLEPPASRPPWAAQGLLDPHRPRASPSARSFHSEGASAAQLLLPPVLSLEDRRPGPVPRDSSQGPQGPAGPSPSGREAASQPRAQRCPARHTDPSSGLPAGVSPLKPLPPSALLPPGPCRPGPRPALRPPAGPSAQQEKKVSTRPGRRPQLPFLQGQLYCQKGR